MFDLCSLTLAQFFFFDAVSNVITAITSSEWLRLDLSEHSLLMRHSVSHHLGASGLQELLRTKLATSQPKPWFRSTGHSNDGPWNEHSWELEQGIHKPKVSRTGLLADCNSLGNPRLCPWVLQHHCGRRSPRRFDEKEAPS